MAEERIEPFSGVILAGGFGKRLRREKASAPVNGRPLLHWTAEALAALTDDLVVVRRADQRLPPDPGVGWREAVDGRADRGPLAGIEAALNAVRHDVAVIVACDMPLLVPDLVRGIVAAAADVDVAIPVIEGREEPLFAAYRRSCLPTVGECLDAGQGRLISILPRLRVRRLAAAALRRFDPELLSLTNVNYPQDLERVGEVLRRRGAK